jgi:hypothetical protein
MLKYKQPLCSWPDSLLTQIILKLNIIFDLDGFIGNERVNKICKN